MLRTPCEFYRVYRAFIQSPPWFSGLLVKRDFQMWRLAGPSAVTGTPLWGVSAAYTPTDYQRAGRDQQSRSKVPARQVDDPQELLREQQSRWSQCSKGRIAALGSQSMEWAPSGVISGHSAIPNRQSASTWHGQMIQKPTRRASFLRKTPLS